MSDTPDSPLSPAPGTAAEPGAAPPALGPGATTLASPARIVPLASGRSLEIAEDEAAERVQIRSAEGQLLLSIRLTDEGPVLSISGASLEIAATKALALSCDTLRIQAAQDADIEVGGSLRERVRGSVARDAGRSARISAQEVQVDASPGGVVIQANDDVAITGERVRLNSDDPPMPLSWEEHRARRAAAATRPQLAWAGPDTGGGGALPSLGGPEEKPRNASDEPGGAAGEATGS
ncbi:hypothetical protein [Sorangium sp. So ce426]|uniref:hypothetical protein n=1 Tax=Sorangium sp. So ce426 TaxID=3133312 RepID=UPI003F5CB828